MGVRFTTDRAVGTITLDSPPANSCDTDLMRSPARAIGDASRAPEVRVVVLRSANEGLVTAGADVKRFLANPEANMEMDQLRAHVERLAAGRLAIANIKRAVYEGLLRPLDGGLALERELVEELFRSRDAGEGLAAFSEKPSPTFVGA